MTLQNRVTPFGEIEAAPARGDFMGNRGILHGDTKELGHRRWTHNNWIICLTSFRGRPRQIMTPHQYTELFFLDEAVALAAGHRPCYECRRKDYHTWAAAWQRATRGDAPPRAKEMDQALHKERIIRRPRRQQCWRGAFRDLPDGAFISWEGAPYLVLDRYLLRWTHHGYTETSPRPTQGEVIILTPPTSVATLANGFRPRLHEGSIQLIISH
jgi:hypothetical protein